MDKILAPLALSLALAAIPVAARAQYRPVGPQANVALSTVTSGGWSLCYSATMDTPFGTSASTTLANCGGNLILLAGRETGSDTLLALAYASKADALFDTGASNNGIFHAANGSDWFYADNWSWGFKTVGSDLTKFQCDSSPPAGPSMCVHTLTVGGYSINQIVGLNDSSAYEKLVFTANALAVPEPASWAMMILGVGLVGGAMRTRRRSVGVAFAA